MLPCRPFTSRLLSSAMAAVQCGSLHCQKDSYAKRLTSRVVTCAPGRRRPDGKECYEVVLQDTVIFPEGGGQPDDRGTLDGVDVLGAARVGATAVHYLPRPLEVGAEVAVEVDWGRRFDHMQQHSGQHLITAVADRKYGFKTTSWNLAIGQDNRCFVELATPTLSCDQLAAIEEECNGLIRKAVAMTPHWYDPNAPELEEVRSRGLPDNFETSEIRVVEIEGLDSNMCCGTHVSSLAHLQCVKLLFSESRKGATLLYYIVGNRVLRYTQRALDNERALTKLLSVGMSEHREAVEKSLKANKLASKTARSQLRELAQLAAFKHLHSTPLDPLACVHRDDGDNEFMNIIANELTSKGVLVLVTVGGARGSGQFLLAGCDDATMATLGAEVARILEGKGGGRKGRFQGKAGRLENRTAAEEFLRSHLTQQQQAQQD